MLDISKLYVIAVCSNPVRYRSRWNLYRNFEQHIARLGGKLLTVEQSFGRREFQVTDSCNPMHIQIRTDQELWHKENMINIGIQRLTQIDPDWKYVAWIDADVHFHRDDILLETAHQLQHFDIVQMFSHVVNLGPEQQPVKIDKGFMYLYHRNDCLPPAFNQEYNREPGFWHPGFAWAARREAIDKLQLFDRAILGAGDHHMALALIGCAKNSLPGNISDGYKQVVMEWERDATVAFRRNVGYVPGTLSHFWHGSKKNRRYVERWSILIENKFDPLTDLARDSYGLYRLKDDGSTRFISLRDQIRHYFRARNEDSIDYEEE